MTKPLQNVGSLAPKPDGIMAAFVGFARHRARPGMNPASQRKMVFRAKTGKAFFVFFQWSSNGAGQLRCRRPCCRERLGGTARKTSSANAVASPSRAIPVGCRAAPQSGHPNLAISIPCGCARQPGFNCLTARKNGRSCGYPGQHPLPRPSLAHKIPTVPSPLPPSGAPTCEVSHSVAILTCLARAPPWWTGQVVALSPAKCVHDERFILDGAGLADCEWPAFEAAPRPILRRWSSAGQTAHYFSVPSNGHDHPARTKPSPPCSKCGDGSARTHDRGTTPALCPVCLLPLRGRS